MNRDKKRILDQFDEEYLRPLLGSGQMQKLLFDGLERIIDGRPPSDHESDKIQVFALSNQIDYASIQRQCRSERAFTSLKESLSISGISTYGDVITYFQTATIIKLQGTSIPHVRIPKAWFEKGLRIGIKVLYAHLHSKGIYVFDGPYSWHEVRGVHQPCSPNH